MSDASTLPAAVTKLRGPATIVGLVAIGISVAAIAMGNGDEFYRGYLLGYLLVLGLSLGSMGLLFVHHLVGGAWGFVIQRQLEAATRVLPFLAVAFLPILLHVLTSEHPIYHWAEPHAAEHDHLLAHKAPYLNHMGFAIRAGVYFVVWATLIFFLNRFSKKLDVSGDGTIANSLGKMAGPGIVLYMLTMTFAAFDWAMSLDPHWFSTIYGVIFIVGQVLSAMAFMILAVSFTRHDSEFGHAITTDRLHDLAKLMFAFTCLWAYVQLSQFLIIWYGNMPEETIFYHLRLQGGWQYVTVSLVFCQFVFPFAMLLSRWPKRSMKWAPRIAAFILAVRLLDLYVYVMPHAEKSESGDMIASHLHMHWVHFTAPIGLFALWVVVFIWNLGKRPLLPSKDPRWKEILSHAH